ncbi:hypothetical protein DE146DRAFT_769686 [Phaeosphaeria sp. MPI-PUGE-AT-0046c]|nr:hypothetical protein DE146DRAFT_769686 [Phaeosphaeria sp. MPI-PUGE-AT-0046c]
MRTLTFLLAVLANNPIATAQVYPYPKSCTGGLSYTATAISRTFDWCGPAFAYGASFAPNPTSYVTDLTGCINLCTSSCVAANYAQGGHCFIALGSVQYISTATYWAPSWTAYVARTTASALNAPTTSPSPRTIPTPQFSTIPGLVAQSPSISSSTPISPTFSSLSVTSSSSVLPSTSLATGLPSLSSPIPSDIVVSKQNNLTCPDSNGTVYTNAFGTQFTVLCALDLYDANPELRTVQPNFQSCIDDCDKRFPGRCPGVTWVSNKQWCFFKPSNTTRQPAVDTLWSAVQVAGPNGLTCPQANGTVYTDGVYTDMLVDQFSVYCGFDLVDPTTARRSAQLTFEACMSNCNEDSDCDGVTWRPNGEDQRWCYQKSRSAVLRSSSANYWSAQKIYNNIISAATFSQSPVTMSLLSIGSSIIGGSSSAISPASLTTIDRGLLGQSPVPVTPVCPAGNQTIYTARDRSAWRLDCNIDYMGNDWVQIQTATLQECIDACASRGPSCFGVVQVPSRNPNCYLKSGALSADRKVIQPFVCDSAVRLNNGNI